MEGTFLQLLRLPFETNLGVCFFGGKRPFGVAFSRETKGTPLCFGGPLFWELRKLADPRCLLVGA